MKTWIASYAMLAQVLLAGAVVGAHGGAVEHEIEARLRTFLREIRCLVCQNETLAESRAELAVDLREEIRAQMHAGRTDGEIRAFLLERYGDFVLYRPRLVPGTYPLWFGPFLLLGIGVVVLWRIVTRRTADTAISSSADLQRARRLLSRGVKEGSS